MGLDNADRGILLGACFLDHEYISKGMGIGKETFVGVNVLHQEPYEQLPPNS